jgi:eukaryotic-like serine/threonine-protein kinase
VDPERWQHIKRVVGDALDVEPARRAAFVQEACGQDTKLRAEIESLLAGTGERLETFADELDSSLRGQNEETTRAGERLGAYEVVREIGRGGMGAVYLARRADEQYDKQVAIKVLKRGTDTDEVLRRFRAERQILARLDHPNIARLLDAGTTDDGLPYFVMEYVEGERITEFCSRHNLSVRERLELFLKVCAAIHFAHQRLIVHRDIKPGNILVTADREPKLLDFGIAKLLDDAEGGIEVTAPDRQRLTPGYASPEQVRGDAITTVSDVYSLGALLYELLTGAPPHRFGSAHPSPTELFHVIAEQEPASPSSAAPALRGDLDNILLQALRKEPARRYPGVNAFAEDIRRYLNNFPVRARRDTFGYRTSKFVKRHRVGVAAAAVVALALIGGITVAVWQARVASVERAKAVQRFNEVRELARSVLFDYHDPIAALPGSTEVRRRLVQDARKYLDNLAKEASGDRALLRELADAYEKLAAVQGGVARTTGGNVLSASNLGDTAGAIASMEKALAIREQLAQLSANDPAAMQALSEAYVIMAGFYITSGPPQTAVDYLQKAIPIAESLLATHPTVPVRLLCSNAYMSIGRALGSPSGPNVGDTRGALAYMQGALKMHQALATEFPQEVGYQQSLVAIHNGLGLIYSAMGEREEELEQSRKAIAVARRIVQAEPDNPFYRRELAVQLGNTGSALMQGKQTAEALELFREALTIYDALVAADPNDVPVRRQWAVAHRNVAVAIGGSDPAQAHTHFGKATDILTEIVAKDPKNTDFGRQLAFTHLAKSRFQLEINDPAAAVLTAQEGTRLAEQLAAASPGDIAVQRTLALLFTQLGHSHAKVAAAPADTAGSGSWQRAKEAFAGALAVYERLRADGKLSAADAKKPEELAREIAHCETALVARGR